MTEKTIITAYVTNMIENVAIVIGVVYAAIAFGKPVLLWFLVLSLFNGITVRQKATKNEEKENEGQIADSFEI